MSTFRSAMRLARAVLPGSASRKTKARVGARIYRPKKARRASGPNSVITKKFTTLEDPIDVGSGGFSVGTETFELADMPQFSNYIALYEQFKITKIVYHFRSQAPVNVALSAGGVGSLGYLHTVVDHNDNTTPAGSLAGIQNMMNDSGYKGVKSSRDLTRVIRPMFLTQAGTQTAKSVRGWLNCRDVAGAVNAVSHYGIKWIVQGGRNVITGTTQSVSYQPIVTYYIQFKNPQ